MRLAQFALPNPLRSALRPAGDGAAKNARWAANPACTSRSGAQITPRNREEGIKSHPGHPMASWHPASALFDGSKGILWGHIFQALENLPAAGLPNFSIS
jgi:hypothetical protein